MRLQISRRIALVVGIGLPLIETWRRWGGMQDVPAWLDDYIAGALLLYGWYAGRPRIDNSRPYLMAAWGYTFGMAYQSFFGQLHSTLPDPSGVAKTSVLAFKGFGMALALCCLLLAWPGKVKDSGPSGR